MLLPLEVLSPIDMEIIQLQVFLDYCDRIRQRTSNVVRLIPPEHLSASKA